MIALDARQRMHKVLVADHEADSPTGHVVALAHGEKLDRHIAGTRHLHDRRRLVAIEGDVGISEVVDHQDVVLAGERDHPLKKVEIDALGGRIARKTQDHHLGLWEGLSDRALELVEEIDTGGHAHRADISTGNDRAIDVNRVARIGHQHGIAAIEGGKHQMRQAFLGADGHDRLGIGIEFDLISALVPVADRAPQTRYALGDRIAVGIRPGRGFDQLVDDMLGRGAVRVAHAHIDDVFATTSGGHLELGREIEDVGREPTYAGEIALCAHWDSCSSAGNQRDRTAR